MPLYNLNAVVIKSQNLGEADKVLTLYSHERGKLRAVARGARRPRNRLRAGAEVFTHGSYLLFANQGLDTVSQCEIVDSFRGLREDLERAAAATYCLEVLDRLTEEEEPKEDLFPFLLAVLHLLAGGSDLDLAVRAFEVGILGRLGYAPELTACISCGAPLKEEAAFSAKLGGALCPKCRAADGQAFPVRGRTLAALRYLARAPFSRLGLLRLPPESRAELREITRACLLAQLGRDLNSAAFLALVQGGAPGVRS
ncbi:MAG: repair protein RecO [Bacillota bacterium]|jgi:DNA repair protein RecO (recombination protein O)|nr:repair protein RecO [Bacillota bacterium]MDK2882443.1 repair protein RecO [Bacillota bacterium]MDK2924336.1 repair protein RecO [Bacillota bacterium]